jgi:HTH-like domain
VSVFIDEQRERFGVEPICRTLGVSASAYYQRATGEPSTRRVDDDRLVGLIGELHRRNYFAYGSWRMWKALLRAGELVGRGRVERLMRANGIQGAKRRGKPWLTTYPNADAYRPADLVKRDFAASRADQLWFADFTYLRCWEGVVYNGRRDVLPFPKQPGSMYHCSKVHDSTNIQLACRVWGLRATDLNQGVVYGIQTLETTMDPRLATRFDYDEMFGTALNRFCVQAVIGHPLTVYGKGGQTRGYLNIVDTLRCVELTAENPPDAGTYRVFNQFTEQFSIRELAGIVADAAAELGIAVTVEAIENPRVEIEEHYYNAKHTRLADLGLEPTLPSATLVESMLSTIRRHQRQIVPEAILPRTQWRAVRELV